MASQFLWALGHIRRLGRNGVGGRQRILRAGIWSGLLKEKGVRLERIGNILTNLCFLGSYYLEVNKCSLGKKN